MTGDASHITNAARFWRGFWWGFSGCWGWWSRDVRQNAWSYIMASDKTQTAKSFDSLFAGFMRHVQNENQCPVTGDPCREAEKCGCFLEMQEWCKE